MTASPSRASPRHRSIPGGTAQARISGNGAKVVFTASGRRHLDRTAPPAPSPARIVFRRRPRLARRRDADRRRRARRAIDATGDVVAYVGRRDLRRPGGVRGLGRERERRQGRIPSRSGRPSANSAVGYVAAPAISADGQAVACPTTQPEFDFDPGQVGSHAARHPRAERHLVVRHPGIRTCSGILRHWYDAAEGDACRSRRRGGRSCCSGSSTLSTADEHRCRRSTPTRTTACRSATPSVRSSRPGFVTGIEIADIPLADLPDYSAALANAPIYRLPIYRLPIYRLPIYRLPIYRSDLR